MVDDRRLLSNGFLERSWEVAGRRYSVATDYPPLLQTLNLVLPPGSAPATGDRFVARASCSGDEIEIEASPPDDDGPDEIDAASETEDLPLTRSSDDTFISTEGSLVLTRTGPSKWRITNGAADPLLPALIIWHRMLRLASSSIFLHASSVVSPSGIGLLFIGPKGAGKSTTALTLAQHQDWALLGDETAWYLPAKHEIGPFLRPVGLKPGIRSAQVTASLSARGINPDRSGPTRVAASVLAPRTGNRTVPLGAIFFLREFCSDPEIRELDRSSSQMGNVQPLISSIINAPRRERAFQLASMLSRSKLYELRPGAPETTAELIRRIYP